MFTTEQLAVVSKIAIANGKGEMHGDAVVVMMLIVLMIHAPCVAMDDAVETFYRANESAEELTPKAREATTAIIEDKVGKTIGDLTYTYSSHSGGHKVVDGRWFYLTDRLPHQTSAERIRR